MNKEGLIDEDSIDNSMFSGDQELRKELFESDLEVNDPVVESFKKFKEKEDHLFALETIRQLRQRLTRRTAMIDEIRKFYLRDVVALKHVMRDVLTGTEREIIFREFESAIPSLDLSKALALHAPTNSDFRVRPCEQCGGQLEVIMRDSDEVDRLKKILSDCKDREQRFRLKLGTLDAEIETMTKEKAEGLKSHLEEKRFLYSEMKRLNKEHDEMKEELEELQRSNREVKQENDDFRSHNKELFESAERLLVVEGENRELSRQLAERMSKLQSVQRAEEEAQEEVERQKQEVRRVLGQMDLLAEEQKKTKKEMDEKNEKIEQLQTSLTDQSVKTEQLLKDNQDNKSKAADLQQDLESGWAKKASDLEKTVKDLHVELRRHQRQLERVTQDRKELKQRVKWAESETEYLQQLRQDLEKELQESMEQIESRDEGIQAMQKFLKEEIHAQAYHSPLRDLSSLAPSLAASLDVGDSAGVQPPSEFELSPPVVNVAEEVEEEKILPVTNKKLVGLLKMGSLWREKKKERGSRKKPERPKQSEEDEDSESEEYSDHEDWEQEETTQPDKSARKVKSPLGGRPSSRSPKRKSEKQSHSKSPASKKKNPHNSVGKTNDVIRKGVLSVGKDDKGARKSTTPNASSSVKKTPPAPRQNKSPKRKKTKANQVGKGSDSSAKASTKGDESKQAQALKGKIAPVVDKNMLLEEGEEEEEEEGSVVQQGLMAEGDEEEDEEGDDDDDDEYADEEEDEKEYDSEEEEEDEEDVASPKISQKIKSPSKEAKKMSKSRTGSRGKSKSSHRRRGKTRIVEQEFGQSLDSELDGFEQGISMDSFSADGLDEDGFPSERMVDIPSRETAASDLTGFDDNSEAEEAAISTAQRMGLTHSLSGDGSQWSEEDTRSVSTRGSQCSRRTTSRSQRRASVNKQNLIATANQILEVGTVRPNSAPRGFVYEDQVTKEQKEQQDKEDDEEEADEDVGGHTGEKVYRRGSAMAREMERKKTEFAEISAKQQKDKISEILQLMQGRKMVPVIPIEVKRYVTPQRERKQRSKEAEARSQNSPKSLKEGRQSTPPPHHKQRSHEQPVELDDPPVNASDFERQFRAGLLDALKCYVEEQHKHGVAPGSRSLLTQNMAHRCINALSEAIHEQCSMFQTAIEALWQSMLNNRRGLDFFLKICMITESMLSCASAETTNKDVADICAKLVPLAGASLGVNQLTGEWQKQLDIDAELVTSLTPVLDFSTGRRRDKMFFEYFPADSQEKIHDKLGLSLDAAHKMASYVEDTGERVRDYLVDLLKDWSSAKTVVVDLDRRLEDERGKVKRQMELRVKAVGKELTKNQAQNERHQEQIKELEHQMVELQKVDTKFRECQLALEARNVSHADQGLEIAELKRVVMKHEREAAINSDTIGTLEAIVAERNQIISSTEERLDQNISLAQRLQQDLTTRTEERNRLQALVENMQQQETQRRYLLQDASVQAEPSVSAASVQTEFLTPELQLRTVMLNKSSLASKKQSLVLPQKLPLPNPQSIPMSRGMFPIERTDSLSQGLLAGFKATPPPARDYEMSSHSHSRITFAEQELRGGSAMEEDSVALSMNQSHFDGGQSIAGGTLTVYSGTASGDYPMFGQAVDGISIGTEMYGTSFDKLPPLSGSVGSSQRRSEGTFKYFHLPPSSREHAKRDSAALVSGGLSMEFGLPVVRTEKRKDSSKRYNSIGGGAKMSSSLGRVPIRHKQGKHLTVDTVKSLDSAILNLESPGNPNSLYMNGSIKRDTASPIGSKPSSAVGADLMRRLQEELMIGK